MSFRAIFRWSVLVISVATSSLAQGGGFLDPGKASVDEINHLAIMCVHLPESPPAPPKTLATIRRISSARKGDRYSSRYTLGPTEFEVSLDANHLESIQYRISVVGEQSSQGGRLARMKDDFRFRIKNFSLGCALWTESTLSVEDSTVNLIVHPHFGYDPDRLILDRLTQQRKNSAQTVVLLESLETIRALEQIPDPYYSDREVLNGIHPPTKEEIELPEFPAGTQYFTAPSGLLPFQWNDASPSQVWLSGGYLNACGLNVIKALLGAFARATTSKVDLNIDMSASTLQGVGAGSEMVPEELKGRRMLLADYPISYASRFRQFLTQYETELANYLKNEVKADFDFTGDDKSVLDRIQIRIFDENDQKLRPYETAPNTRTFDVHFKKARYDSK